MKHDWDNPMIVMKHHEPNENEALCTDKPNTIERTLKRKWILHQSNENHLLGILSITSIGTYDWERSSSDELLIVLVDVVVVVVVVVVYWIVWLNTIDDGKELCPNRYGFRKFNDASLFFTTCELHSTRKWPGIGWITQINASKSIAQILPRVNAIRQSSIELSTQ